LSFKNLIPKEYLDIINRKDIKKLKDQSYLAICDSCQHVFLNIPFEQLRQEMADGAWDKPQKWYASAGKHWMLELGDHNVRAYMVEGVHRNLINDLSENWTKGMMTLVSAKGEQEARRLMLQNLEMIDRQAAK
jgi:hypothetical protein